MSRCAPELLIIGSVHDYVGLATENYTECRIVFCVAAIRHLAYTVTRRIPPRPVYSYWVYDLGLLSPTNY